MKEAIKKFKKVRGTTYVYKGMVCAKEKVLVEEIFKRQVYISESMGVGFEWKRI